jgi:NADPH:quinone reductase-like Zn-dependent oxidoreductase/NADP-dependent 3-hydroxy acid dehydrogenase YdfG/acyl carrier protein
VAAVVHLWPLDAPDVERDGLDALGRAEELCCHALTDLLRALDAAGSAPRLAVVTRGSQTVEAAPRAASCGQALAWGLAGAIASERPELEVRRIDLDPSAGVDGEALRRELGAGDEDQVALREGRRYAARLASMELPESPDAVHVVEPGEAVFRLEVETPGLLDSIRLVPAERRAPGPGEVEIEVEAAALNFLDVLKAMGLGPGIEVAGSATLGGECAGRVVAVGAGVESVRPGDAVLAIAPSFRGAGLIASHAVVPAALVTRRPDRLRATEGVTGPIAFLTARIALLERAGLRAGETVLVHSAAGGVGLAAVQVARQAGATVLATAGTEEKRAFLRGLGIEHVMDSRSLSFAEEARIATGGRGVDVVLNSLAGDALRLGLDALAPYGRFVEIGKRDIYAGADLALDAFARSLSFIAVDVARDVTEREAEIGEGLRQIAADLDAGSIEPLPTEIYPVAEAAEAVRRMASGEHTGKVVLETTGAPIPISVPAERAAVRADATYLLTGGLGALGLEAASALVEAGARSLLLVGRREPGDAARAAIAELEARGAAVATASLDVADPEALAIVLDRARRELPPLRGVLHAAGILDDGLAETLDPARFRTVLAPKAYGALTLHRATAGLDLDWFCLYSSAATVLGTPAQGSYAAANAFLEALAHTRRSDGLPALAIDWGSWGEVGLAAAQDARGGRLAARGLDPMASDEATAALRRLLPIESAQVAVMRFDAERWCESYPAARKSSLLRRVAQRPTAPVAGLHELLRATEAGERRSLVEEHLRSHLAAVLRVPADRIPLGSPLQALGLDSLLTIELRNRLRASTGLALGASIIFSYPTVAALAGYVDRSLGGPAAENGAAAAAEAQEPLAALSEHELADLLAEELEGARRQLGGTP